MSNEKAGKAPFEMRESDDYSGLDIEARFLDNADIKQTFFNGARIVDCVFRDVDFSNAELSEATIVRTRFENCDMKGADLVLSTLENVEFVRCSFARGEWREAVVRHCNFVDCDFTHTTVTICQFIYCSLDSFSFDSFQHRAVSLNVFSNCEFPCPTENQVLGSHNFGVPLAALRDVPVPAARPGTMTIEQLCALNNIGAFRVVMLLDVASTIFPALNREGRIRGSIVQFFAMIIRALADERRISATSLLYLKMTIAQCAPSIDLTQREFRSAVQSAVIEINNALLTIANERVEAPFEYRRSIPRGLDIRFDRTFDRQAASVLAQAISDVIGLEAGAVRVEAVRGSTYIDVAVEVILGVEVVLFALNHVLRRATVTIREVGAVVRAITSEIRDVNGPSISSSQAALSAVNNAGLPVLLVPEEQIEAFHRLLTIVSRNGRVLMEMDEESDATVQVQQPKDSAKED